MNHDANAWRYLWVERWSEEHKRAYFYNQVRKSWAVGWAVNSLSEGASG